ncbi:MAG: hypothetical protein HYX32_02100 [Actinobacteria bacterium]|nr:hypothetical protein [Actinomycetota bacterium]
MRSPTVEWRERDERLSPRLTALVGAVSLLVSIPYLVLGPGLVMDDWWSLRNVRFDGAFAAAGSDQWSARPGAGVIYTVIFGLIGPHPLVLALLLAVLGAATACLLARLLATVFPPLLAVGASLIWVVMPNRLSVEVWASATNIAVSQVGAAGALLLVARRWQSTAGVVAIGLLTLVAALSYEASIPVMIAAALALGWARGGIEWRATGTVIGVSLASSVWIVLHYHPAKGVSRTIVDISQVVPANFGWGIFPAGAIEKLGLVLGLLVVTIGAARVIARAFRPYSGPGDQMAVAGAVLMVVGALPFLFYSYQPLGGGDRVNYLSSVGGAMVWMGGLDMVRRVDRRLMIVGAVLFVAFVLPVRIERWSLWHDAGLDAADLGPSVRQALPSPPERIVLGPNPIVVQNVAAFVEPYAAEAAVQLAYDDPRVVVRFAESPEEFDATPPDRRFDLRASARLLGR